MAKQRYLRIAHRGASGSRPEHTRPAFCRSLALGVDMIELDVQLTRDRRVVVLHDRELGRTLPGGGPVREHRFEELRALDAGGWFDREYAGERVLSLEDVLDLIAGGAGLNVEIKSPEVDWDETARLVVGILRERRCAASAIVSSFETGALERVRAHDASVRLGVLWRCREREPLWQTARALEAYSVHPQWTLIDATLLREAHARGFAVITWTVNDPGAMRELLALGVDGLISDFPERFP